MPLPVLIAHGGAGSIEAHAAASYRRGCEAAVETGCRLLAQGGTALDAVVATVVVLEENPLFNAGRGSVLTSAGTVETDASAMDGSTLDGGGCGAVSGVRNPILLARAILAARQNVLLVGAGATAFARERGLSLCGPADLITPEQRARWQRRAAEPGPGNTVGAVAADRHGHVAAATSTGGIFYKRPGRVGDSAVIGAGTYADDTTGAASATGAGEAIIRMGLARGAVDRLRDGRDPMAAAQAAIDDLTRRTGASAGLIVVDRLGRIGYAHGTPSMPVAYSQPDGIVSLC